MPSGHLPGYQQPTSASRQRTQASPARRANDSSTTGATQGNRPSQRTTNSNNRPARNTSTTNARDNRPLRNTSTTTSRDRRPAYLAKQGGTVKGNATNIAGTDLAGFKANNIPSDQIVTVHRELMRSNMNFEKDYKAIQNANVSEDGDAYNVAGIGSNPNSGQRDVTSSP
ncbi:hypothetical protein BDQ17DRAFT_1342429 [Cyathus striatus]|nr:hypothetical protein BDQ17DRAFT_1342429 [Cyathus striatus]